MYLLAFFTFSLIYKGGFYVLGGVYANMKFNLLRRGCIGVFCYYQLASVCLY
jgi:hypothetical protein